MKSKTKRFMQLGLVKQIRSHGSSMQSFSAAPLASLIRERNNLEVDVSYVELEFEESDCGLQPYNILLTKEKQPTVTHATTPTDSIIPIFEKYDKTKNATCFKYSDFVEAFETLISIHEQSMDTTDKRRFFTVQYPFVQSEN